MTGFHGQHAPESVVTVAVQRVAARAVTPVVG